MKPPIDTLAWPRMQALLSLSIIFLSCSISACKPHGDPEAPTKVPANPAKGMSRISSEASSQEATDCPNTDSQHHVVKNLQQIIGLLEQFTRRKGRLPCDDEPLLPQLVKADCDVTVFRTRRIRGIKQFTDFWDSPIVYESLPESFVIRSSGLNRIDEGGKGDDIVLTYDDYLAERGFGSALDQAAIIVKADVHAIRLKLQRGPDSKGALGHPLDALPSEAARPLGAPTRWVSKHVLLESYFHSHLQLARIASEAEFLLSECDALLRSTDKSRDRVGFAIVNDKSGGKAVSIENADRTAKCYKLNWGVSVSEVRRIVTGTSRDTLGKEGPTLLPETLSVIVHQVLHWKISRLVGSGPRVRVLVEGLVHWLSDQRNYEGNMVCFPHNKPMNLLPLRLGKGPLLNVLRDEYKSGQLQNAVTFVCQGETPDVTITSLVAMWSLSDYLIKHDPLGYLQLIHLAQKHNSTHLKNLIPEALGYSTPELAVRWQREMQRSLSDRR